jgi:hypothetical protein
MKYRDDKVEKMSWNTLCCCSYFFSLQSRAQVRVNEVLVNFSTVDYKWDNRVF